MLRCGHYRTHEHPLPKAVVEIFDCRPRFQPPFRHFQERQAVPHEHFGPFEEVRVDDAGHVRGGQIAREHVSKPGRENAAHGRAQPLYVGRQSREVRLYERPKHAQKRRLVAPTLHDHRAGAQERLECGRRLPFGQFGE